MRTGRPCGSNGQSKTELGLTLQEARVNSQLTGRQVANYVGISFQFICNIEKGRAPLPWKYLDRISKLLDISAETLTVLNLKCRNDFKKVNNIKFDGEKKENDPS